VSLLVVGALLGESMRLDAVAMGLSMGVVYYGFDPAQKRT
jgi:hypothetical protein